MRPGFDRTIWAGYGDGTQCPEAGPALDSEAPLAASLVGCWPTDEGAGSALANLAAPATAAAGASGVLNAGPAWAAGRDGHALLFNGTSHWGDLKNPAAANSRIFTYEVWFKNTSGTADATLLSETSTADGTSYMDVRLSASNSLRVAYRCANFNAATKDGTRTVNDRGWHLAHLTSDSANLLLYVDGLLDPNFATALAYQSGVQAVNCATLGARRPSSLTAAANFYPGSLARPAMWRRCLTPAEVAARYAEPYAILQLPGSRRSAAGVPGGGGATAYPAALLMAM